MLGKWLLDIRCKISGTGVGTMEVVLQSSEARLIFVVKEDIFDPL
jgi:hypothetical protein